MLVEDDPTWQNLLTIWLKTVEKSTNYHMNIEPISDFTKASKALIDADDWDLLCTDIGLIDNPAGTEGSYLVKIAAAKCIPAIVVTGKPTLNTQDVRNFLGDDNVRDLFAKETFDGKRFVETITDILRGRSGKPL